MNPWLTVIHSPDLPRDAHRIHVGTVALHDGAPRTPRMLWANPTRGVLVVQGSTPITAERCPWRHSHIGASQPVCADWQPGDVLKFSLIGNPVKSLRRDQCGGKVRRVPLTDPAQRDAWMHRQLGAFFADITADGQPLSPSISARPDGKRPVQTRHLWVGIATVADPAALRAAIIGGIGHGKAYGCGLMIVQSAA